jgi:hypothetical protein
MSYNIDNWKLKRLENFSIPMSAFFESPRKDWHPEIEKDGCLTILSCGCEQEIKGIEKADVLHINHINMSGEGSGSFFHHVLDNALKKSNGILEAVRIWEGGDSIDRLFVENGKVSVTEIEL